MSAISKAVLSLEYKEEEDEKITVSDNNSVVVVVVVVVVIDIYIYLESFTRQSGLVPEIAVPTLLLLL